MALQLNQDTCQRVQCGAIPAAVLNDPANRFNGLPLQAACSVAGWQGPLGGRYCDDPVCKPYRAQILTSGWGQGLECCVQQGGNWVNNQCQMPSTLPTAAPMPKATSMAMPSVTDTVNSNPPTPAPVLSPALLVQKMPSIVNPAPMNVAPVPCSNDFAQWVNDNPLIAVAGLAVVGYFLLNK